MSADARGAKCEVCQQHMLAADGCIDQVLVLPDGRRFHPTTPIICNNCHQTYHGLTDCDQAASPVARQPSTR